MRLHAGLGALFGPASGWAWALTIVVLVVLMRLLLLPLFIKQMHATRKMTVLAPQVAELKKKHKNDKQKLNEETMKLYKENGANPLAGCLPIAAQLPVFFALFGVLRAISQDHPKDGMTSSVVTSAQHAHIFGVTVADRFLSSIKPPTLFPLSSSGRVVILITVLVSAATTFMTVRQSTKGGMTPQMTPDNPMASSQKFMAYIVPVFALSGLYWQYGLVLYWVTTNLWTLGQQHVLFKRFPPLTPAAAGGGAAGGAGAAAKPSAKPAVKAPARPVNQLRGRTTQSGGAAPGRAESCPRDLRCLKDLQCLRDPRRPLTAATVAVRAACCAGSAEAARNPSPKPSRPRPKLSSSGSSQCASRVVGALASGEAADDTSDPHGAWTVRIRNKEDPVVSQGENAPTVTSDDVADLPLAGGVE